MDLQSVFISLLEKAGSSGNLFQLSSVMELLYSGLLRKLASGTPKTKSERHSFQITQDSFSLVNSTATWEILHYIH